jgi:tRNA-specific adenosine deaminase 3
VRYPGPPNYFFPFLNYAQASAYIVEVPNRSASELLDVLRDVVPAEVMNSLQHLRRFAKPEYLPRHLLCIDHHGDDVDVSKPLDGAVLSSRTAKSTTSHVLVCPTDSVPITTLENLFEHHVTLFDPLVPHIREVSVPVFAPTSATQAAEWSEKYWPTIYKNTNPYGPHPAMVRRAELELLANGEADRYMDLARCVAKANVSHGCGTEVGVVIVERLSSTKKTRVVSVAGDARFTGLRTDSLVPRENSTQPPCTDNVIAHAALRAISMVAQKRRVLAELADNAAANRDDNAEMGTAYVEAMLFATNPLCDLESEYVAAVDNLTPTGYLCLDLEIYLTHEPCVMCAMAILHSRFSRVVFGKQMLESGALSAEGSSLGHGLFWRDQLNWKFLAWQWQPLSSDGAPVAEACGDRMQA